MHYTKKLFSLPPYFITKLAEQVRRNVEKGREPAGTKVKVMEDGGRGAKRGLVRSNQFPREKCQRVNCQDGVVRDLCVREKTLGMKENVPDALPEQMPTLERPA